MKLNYIRMVNQENNIPTWVSHKTAFFVCNQSAWSVPRKIKTIGEIDMKREDLKDLGLTDERDDLKSQLGEWDKQLDSLQKSSRDVDDLNEQIKQLQSDNKKDNEEWQNKLATQTKNFKIETALREAELETLVEVISAKAKEDRPVSPREALRRLRGK